MNNRLLLIFLILTQKITAQPGNNPSSTINLTFKNNTSQHLRLADSVMISIFGEVGFKQFFKLECFKDLCIKNDTGKYLQPCDTNQLSNCTEANITYTYINNKVPMKIEMYSFYNGKNKYCKPIVLWNYLTMQIPINHLQLLSPDEIIKRKKRKFKKLNIVFSQNTNIKYSINPIVEPLFKTYPQDTTIKEYPQHKVIKLKAANNWKGGFYYIAYDSTYDFKHDDEKLHYQKQFLIDAETGEILYEIILIGIKDEKLKHYNPKKPTK